MNNQYKEWLINLICLKDGKSYLFTTNPHIQTKIEKLFQSKFKCNLLVLKQFMLRKEIMKKAKQFTI